MRVHPLKWCGITSIQLGIKLLIIVCSTNKDSGRSFSVTNVCQQRKKEESFFFFSLSPLTLLFASIPLMFTDGRKRSATVHFLCPSENPPWSRVCVRYVTLSKRNESTCSLVLTSTKGSVYSLSQRTDPIFFHDSPPKLEIPVSLSLFYTRNSSRTGQPARRAAINARPGAGDR